MGSVERRKHCGLICQPLCPSRCRICGLQHLPKIDEWLAASQTSQGSGQSPRNVALHRMSHQANSKDIRHALVSVLQQPRSLATLLPCSLPSFLPSFRPSLLPCFLASLLPCFLAFARRLHIFICPHGSNNLTRLPNPSLFLSISFRCFWYRFHDFLASHVQLRMKEQPPQAGDASNVFTNGKVRA